MKIAVTTMGSDLNSDLSFKFGRSPKIMIYESEDGSFDVFDNQESVKSSHGAGNKSAEALVRLGAKILITGQCGPNATNALREAGVDVLFSNAQTVREALEQNQYLHT